jgi:hypothetical protein
MTFLVSWLMVVFILLATRRVAGRRGHGPGAPLTARPDLNKGS